MAAGLVRRAEPLRADPQRVSRRAAGGVSQSRAGHEPRPTSATRSWKPRPASSPRSRPWSAAGGSWAPPPSAGGWPRCSPGTRSAGTIRSNCTTMTSRSPSTRLRCSLTPSGISRPRQRGPPRASPGAARRWPPSQRSSTGCARPWPTGACTARTPSACGWGR